MYEFVVGVRVCACYQDSLKYSQGGTTPQTFHSTECFRSESRLERFLQSFACSPAARFFSKASSHSPKTRVLD